MLYKKIKKDFPSGEENKGESEPWKSTIQEPESTIQEPESTIQEPESTIQGNLNQPFRT